MLWPEKETNMVILVVGLALVIFGSVMVFGISWADHSLTRGRLAKCQDVTKRANGFVDCFSKGITEEKCHELFLERDTDVDY